MKSLRKIKLIAAAFAVILTVGITKCDVYAAAGTTADPVILADAGTTKADVAWNETNCKTPYCFKLTTNSSRLLHLEFSKGKGNARKLDVVVYNAKDNSVVWKTGTYYSAESAIETKHSHCVGVPAGTYLITVKPAVTLSKSDAQTINCEITVSKSVDGTDFELEPNEVKGTATPMKLSWDYAGYLGDSDSSDDNDYYSVNLEAGKIYDLKIKNFSKLYSTTMLMDLATPSGKSYDVKYLTAGQYGQTDSEGTGILRFKTLESGNHYIRFWNYGQLQLGYEVSVTRNTTATSAPTIGVANGSSSSTGSTATGTNTASTTVNTKIRYGWNRDAYGWWYRNPNGGYSKAAWQKINGHWYYFNAAGYMTTGWLNVGNKWYYMNNVGEMQTGWVSSDGQWYFMKDDGAMATGWVKSSGKWYLLGSNGAMVTGWTKSGNKWYYLTSAGDMATGWKKIDGKWYYFNANGDMATGWKQIDGKWYYLYSDGHMAADETIDGYYVNGAGEWK